MLGKLGTMARGPLSQKGSRDSSVCLGGPNLATSGREERGDFDPNLRMPYLWVLFLVSGADAAVLDQQFDGASSPNICKAGA